MPAPRLVPVHWHAAEEALHSVGTWLRHSTSLGNIYSHRAAIRRRLHDMGRHGAIHIFTFYIVPTKSSTIYFDAVALPLQKKF